jgi:hypothetical protein
MTDVQHTYTGFTAHADTLFAVAILKHRGFLSSWDLGVEVYHRRDHVARIVEFCLTTFDF